MMTDFDFDRKLRIYYKKLFLKKYLLINKTTLLDNKNIVR